MIGELGPKKTKSQSVFALNPILSESSENNQIYVKAKEYIFQEFVVIIKYFIRNILKVGWLGSYRKRKSQSVFALGPIFS